MPSSSSLQGAWEDGCLALRRGGGKVMLGESRALFSVKIHDTTKKSIEPNPISKRTHTPRARQARSSCWGRASGGWGRPPRRRWT